MGLDLEGRDHLVLGRLLYTLGVVIHAAVSLPVSLRHTPRELTPAYNTLNLFVDCLQLFTVV